MVLTASSIIRDKIKLKNFKLLNTTKNKQENISKYFGKKGTLIIFMCNHCPYVVHLIDHIISFCKKIKESEILSIAISSNDIVNYPQDSPEKMSILTREKKIEFPYFFDHIKCCSLLQNFVSPNSYYLIKIINCLSWSVRQIKTK